MTYEQAGDLIERMGWQKNVRGNTRMLPWALSNPEREIVVESYVMPEDGTMWWLVLPKHQRLARACSARGEPYTPAGWLEFATEEQARACATTIKLMRSACP